MGRGGQYFRRAPGPGAAAVLGRCQGTPHPPGASITATVHRRAAAYRELHGSR